VEISKKDYICKVLGAYRRTPGTTGALRRNDRLLAATLYDRGVPIIAVENALLLAASRRIFRSPDAVPLQPIRSLYYLLPVIDEVLRVLSAGVRRGGTPGQLPAEADAKRASFWR
jgi:hypothetical protein